MAAAGNAVYIASSLQQMYEHEKCEHFSFCHQEKKNSPFLAQTVLLSLLAVLTMVDWPMLPIFTISKDIIPF